MQPPFTSTRERRLWFGAAAVTAAIFSTLGLGQALAGKLLQTGVVNGLFGLGGLLVVVTILTHGLTRRPRGAAVGAATGIVAVYLLLFVRMATTEQRTHLVEYGVLAVFTHEALRERLRGGPRPVLAPAGLALVITLLIGWIDEGIQALIPSRVFDLRDVLFNTLATLMAIGASLVLAWAARGRPTP